VFHVSIWGAKPPKKPRGDGTVWNCCNLSTGVALNARFTTNGTCAKNNTTYICGAYKQ